MTPPLQDANDPEVEAAGAPAAEATRVTNASQATQAHTQGISELATPATMIGMQLGPYRILAKIGQGGMGAVYKALHVKLDKIVALKVLPQNLTQDPDLVTRFEREMKAVGKLEHPNIVRAMDAGEIAGTHFLAMEFIEGEDLLKWVSARGPVSVPDACQMIQQAALALATAHAAGLVHRDIKPGNLLYSPQTQQVKVLDLGLALLQGDAGQLTELTAMGQAFGTADYMAPEQWEDSHKVDGRTDLYALGCTLFFLLTGRPPYGREDVKSLAARMKSHLLGEIPDLKLLVPSVPDGVAAVYQKLLAKHPGERYQTATELAEALAPHVPKQRDTSPKPLPVALVIGMKARAEAITLTGTPDPLRRRSTAAKSSSRLQATLQRWIIGGTVAASLLCGLGLWMYRPHQPKPVQNESDAFNGHAASAEPLPPLTKTPNYAKEREVAEWVLSIGGKLVVADVSRNEQTLAAVPLPDWPFTVRGVFLKNNQIVRDTDARRLIPLVDMQSLLCMGCRQITDATAADLVSIQSLTQLDLAGSSCTDRSLKSISQLENLQILSLEGTGVTAQGLQLLQPLYNLRELNLIHLPVDLESLRSLKAIPLTSLSLIDTQLTTADLSEIAVLFPQLEYLFLPSRDGRKADDYLGLAQFTQLRSLGVHPRLLEQGIFNYLQDLSNLRCFMVHETTTNLETFAPELANVPQINELHVGLAQNIDDNDLAALSRVSTIQNVIFGQTRFGDHHLQQLTAMRSLRRLELYSSQVTAAGVQKFHEERPDVTLVGDFNVPAESPVIN